MAASDDHLRTLLQNCGQNDHAALERLYALVSAKLFALCHRMLRQEPLAEEALQETFVQIWRDASSYDSTRAAPMTWMAVIARHRCLDLLRRRRHDISLDDDDSVFDTADERPGPLELTLQWSDRNALGQCLKLLSKQQQICVTMAFFQGMSHQEVSSYLATPIGTVKSWIRRGLERLRTCLQP